ncbi:unnamed protein product [Urochloa decumbens]|uniref:pectinesterase n=1 Tax=Urochloa decumbens TaxID=240449 RepID=A0ABC9AB03_9POAL
MASRTALITSVLLLVVPSSSSYVKFDLHGIYTGGLTHQGTAAGVERTPSTTEAAVRSRIRLQAALTITVDQSGKGNYTKIQDAINAVPKNNNSGSAGGVLIKIMPGTYSEKVIVDKTGISLIGTSASSTIVTWSGRWTSEDSATIHVRCTGSDFVARNITFQNTYGPGAQAIAARVSGDKAAFYGCRFVSFQDTILDETGRHYYSNCYVEGATDFMFGNGKAFFEKCHLNSTSTNGGAFTAHGREAEANKTGFSFVDCNLTGIRVGKSILGRPWFPYARVVFARCNMSNAVDPVGWNNWGHPENERTAFFGQFQCYGEGSRTDARVSWSHNHMSPAEAKPFLTKEDWVDGKEWIN